MADVQPLRGVRFNPEHIKLGGVLAPPYDVISNEQREALYARDLRNIVRIDFGHDHEDDVEGLSDRYTRGAQHLEAWLKLEILMRDGQPSFYVVDHEFIGSDGNLKRRRGIYGRVLARPWEQSDVRPHELTLRGPKEDRLLLMLATRTQTSAVFMLWRNAADPIDELLATVCAQPPTFGGRTEGENGSEKHLMWHVADGATVAALHAALEPATLYIADGHHRYETAAAYAELRRKNEPGAPHPADFEYTLAYMCSSDSDALELLPTHRLITPRTGLPSSGTEWAQLLGVDWTFVDTDDLEGALRAARNRRASHHAFAVRFPADVGMLTRPRRAVSSPRAALDVVVLEDELLQSLGIDADAIRDGALRYTRDPSEVIAAVSDGQAALGIALNAVTPDEVLAVADAGEVMPQKSTYFYPKVPTGLVLSPL